MTITQLISISIQGSMALMVFCVMLDARLADLVYLWRRPSLLARSLLSMNVLMPAIAIAIAFSFADLDRSLKIALIAMSVSPVPPFLPSTEVKAGGRTPYVVGLLAVSALSSIVFVPAAAAFIGRLFGEEVHTDASKIAFIVGSSLLAPLVLGIAVGRLAPSAAKKISRPLSIFAALLLVAAFLPVLAKIWPAIAASAGNYTLLTIVAFAVAALVAGHLLGGPAAQDRTVLALSTTSRHPGVALAIANGTPSVVPVIGVVLVCVVTGAVLGALYVKVTGRGGAAYAH
ncbi:MAG TPA: Na+-dependent transporter [Gammaproteobacteria bacterium]|nr:Na+-dependent transporter [Gammaproteobacteria bacterium]